MQDYKIEVQKRELSSKKSFAKNLLGLHSSYF